MVNKSRLQITSIFHVIRWLVKCNRSFLIGGLPALPAFVILLLVILNSGKNPEIIELMIRIVICVLIFFSPISMNIGLTSMAQRRNELLLPASNAEKFIARMMFVVGSTLFSLVLLLCVSDLVWYCIDFFEGETTLKQELLTTELEHLYRLAVACLNDIKTFSEVLLLWVLHSLLLVLALYIKHLYRWLLLLLILLWLFSLIGDFEVLYEELFGERVMVYSCIYVVLIVVNYLFAYKLYCRLQLNNKKWRMS